MLKLISHNKSSFKFGLLLIAGLLGLMLASCGASTPTVSPSPPTATTVSPVTATLAATLKPTVIPPTPTSPGKGITPTLPAPKFNPVIRFSAATIELGGNLTVSGSGYPPETRVFILVGEDIQEWNAATLSATTTEKGMFAVNLKLDTDTYKRPLQAGQVLIQATTSTSADGIRYAAGARINLIIANPKPPVFNPMLKITSPIQSGTEVTLSGSGYPPNLDLQLLGGYNPEGGGAVLVSSTRTDANGNFTKLIRLVTDAGTPLNPGTFVLVARTADIKVSVIINITLT
jgi:hypothetical protein